MAYALLVLSFFFFKIWVWTLKEFHHRCVEEFACVRVWWQLLTPKKRKTLLRRRKRNNVGLLMLDVYAYFIMRNVHFAPSLTPLAPRNYLFISITRIPCFLWIHQNVLLNNIIWVTPIIYIYIWMVDLVLINLCKH